MVKAAQEIPADQALGRSADELAAELIERFRIEPLEPDWDAVSASKEDAQVDVSGDQMRAVYDRSRPAYVPGTRITLHIPFVGEADLFKAKPSRFSLVPPTGVVYGGELRMTATIPHPIPPDLKGVFSAETGRVKEWVSWVNADVEEFNRRLEEAALRAAEARREKVRHDEEAMASLGVPIRIRDDAPHTYVPPTIRRKASRPPPRTRQPQPLEPVFPAEEYERVLVIIRGMVSVMERSPKTFSGMAEEDLRQHFLVQLNGQYQGSATGETFNFEGKTDILVREGNRNLFIAECKFWRGAKTLTETIDQLLRYTSWRDTKTAILVFNRTRDLTKVLEQISSTVGEHPNFVRQIGYGGETEFRFVLHHRDDRQRELTLTVLVFEVPR